MATQRPVADLGRDVSDRELLAQVATDAGQHFAMLHNCGPLSGLGPVGIENGEIIVTDYDTDSWSAWLRSTVESNRVPLNEFADLEPDIRQFVFEAVEGLSEIEPVPIHYDYRPKNLVLNRQGGIKTVLDWGAVRSAHSVYELVLTEQYLSKWAPLDSEVRGLVRDHLYGSYTRHRPFNHDTIMQYRKLYLVVTQLSALAQIQALPEQDRPQQLSRHKTFFRKLL
ncbi:phosphotransferase [Halostagnicola bangensis]